MQKVKSWRKPVRKKKAKKQKTKKREKKRPQLCPLHKASI
jgi:hypothetical protein